MNIVKIFYIVFISCFLLNIQNAFSYEIKQKKLNGIEYKEPVYEDKIGLYTHKDQFTLWLYADEDNFPYSSDQQGSVFNKIFEDLFEKEHIAIKITRFEKEYYEGFDEGFKAFEVGKIKDKGIFATHYENSKYGKNKYLYPAFAENEIYIITSLGKNINTPNKEGLKQYKGAYAKEDFLPSFVIKDLSKLGAVEKNNFSDAFEALLTGEIDYVAASNYKSQIFLYKLGLRNYVKYSVDAVWKAPLFIKLTPQRIQNSRLEYLKKYFKTEGYKQKRDEAFRELLKIYEENTKGIVPPTYVKNIEEVSQDAKQKVEN
ncbi:MAG: hypothetical protein IJZ30_06275 [Alphaproteobacteria bacterium]|nr:hypothetical protein [Alphaproteobacteria bacterium]